MKIGFFGSCQLNLCSNFFFNDDVLSNNDIKIMFNLPFYIYDEQYSEYNNIINHPILDYSLFENIDVLVIENNNLTNQASSKKIIEYCLKLNIKIIKTCLLKFPIYPLNWSGYGENKKDYEIWDGLNNINYITKFDKCIDSLLTDINKTDLDIYIINFIKNNFNKKLLFTHSLHPTNILLYELYKSIFNSLNIDITKNQYYFNGELIQCWYNPFTTKMMIDLKVEFTPIINDNFYIDRYKNNKYILNLNENVDCI
jgi:hypothetical protein